MIRTQLLSNILLAFVWVALTGTFTLGNFTFGFVVCFIIMWLISTDRRNNQYFNRFPRIISFFFFFLYELAKANYQVASDVITPKNMKPGIIRIPLDAKSNIEITLLANLINLTPGTIVVDISDDRKVFYVHAIFVQDKVQFIKKMKNGLEKKLLRILR
ncbi:MAG: Na+/H+ antiporter subunit E [Anditalea sp.]